MKKLLGLLFVSSFALASNAVTITQNGTGYDGLFWSYWKTGGGSAALNLLGGGHFSSSWNSVGDCTMGKGWNPGSARLCGYNAGVYWNTGGGTGGMYGWQQNPQTEWYVNEKWGSVAPYGGTYLGNFWSDGSSYNMYKTQLYGSSPSGNVYFWQVYSSRTSQAPSGNRAINTGNHFYAWKQKGVPFGTTFWMMFWDTEGWAGSGGADVTVW
jgi:endo-1,4-beta-xylanase